MTGRRRLARQQAERYGWPAAVRGFLDAHGLATGPGLPGAARPGRGPGPGRSGAAAASAGGYGAGGSTAGARGRGGSPP